MPFNHQTKTTTNKPMQAATTTLLDPDTDEEIEVEFSYSPPYEGRKEYGAPIEPDEPEEFNFNKATKDGEEIDLTDEQLREAEEQVANGE